MLGWFALLVYVVALWAYTLLPLPSDSYACVGTQLVPFASLADAQTYPHASIGELLRNPAIQQVVLNIALFAPLGFLLRSMFRRGIIVATVGGFGASLLIELTQLTGVWGIFPCAYRLFDVDDLMANTLGALIGSLVALVVVRRRNTSQVAATPRPVTAGRRLLGMLCDVLIVGILGSVLAVGFRAVELYLLGIPFDRLNTTVETWLAVGVPLAAQLASVLITGSTLGEHVVLLRGRAAGLPPVLGRPLRFVFGIGGYGILSASLFPSSALLLVILCTATLITLWASKNHRGLACVLSGMTVVDARGTIDEDTSEQVTKLSN
nr:VanZ family protein [Lysinibacter cavernae]